MHSALNGVRIRGWTVHGGDFIVLRLVNQFVSGVRIELGRVSPEEPSQS